MIARTYYYNQIKGFINKPLIKIITGIRRCGKSVMLKLLIKELLTNHNVKEENVIYINFESFQYNFITNGQELYDYIKNKISNKKRFYILLDEIQEVHQWEKAINSFQVDFNVDIYVTGSNSQMLSSELATYLSGRYVQINMFTLSFPEYLEFKKVYNSSEKLNIYQDFDKYIKLGGFPAIHVGNYTETETYNIVFDIYSSVILRDVVQRFRIRDIELIERVVKYVFDNIGNSFSAKNVADYFKSQQRKLDLNTVYNYLNALESSFIIHKVPRYNIRGKEILKTFEKYFLGDQSLLYAVMGYKESNISGILENIVLLALKQKGYQVYIGKLDQLEIDFIAVKKSEKIYIQVTYKMTEKTTVEREYKPLQKIKDNYPKYIISLDKSWHESINGIKHLHIADFLLNEID